MTGFTNRASGASECKRRLNTVLSEREEKRKDRRRKKAELKKKLKEIMDENCQFVKKNTSTDSRANSKQDKLEEIHPKT